MKMKKIYALLLAAVMACLCVFAAAEETTETLAGEWFLTSMTADGMTVDPAVAGMAMTLALNEDGTVKITTVQGEDEDVAEGTWAPAENGIALTVDGETMEWPVENGVIKGAMGDIVLELSREKPEAEELPTAIAAESEEAFFGTWVPDKIYMAGVMMPVAQLGEMLGIDTQSRLAIEAGIATEYSGTGDDAVVVPYTTSFTDGALTLSLRNPLYEEQGGEEFTNTVYSLTEEGSLTCALTLGDTELRMYLIPFVPPEE